MRVLFVTKRQYMSHDLMGDRFGRNYHIPVGLTTRGFEVRVIAGDYSRGLPEALIEGDLRFESYPLGIETVATFVMRVLRIAHTWRPQFVVGNGDIHFGLFAWLGARICGAKFVYELYDNYLAFDAARLPGFPALHRWLIRKADRVIAVSDPLADFARRLGARTVSVVGNGVDTGVFRPRERAEARVRVGIAVDARIVGYVGGITDSRGVAELVGAVAILRQRDSRLQLMLVGPNLSSLDFADPWVCHVPPVHQTVVPDYISAFDVAVLPYLDDEWGRFTHPQKLGEYLACSVPIVATRLPGYAAIDGLDGVQWATPGSAEDLARAIEEQLTAPCTGELPAHLTWAGVVDAAHRTFVTPFDR